MYTITLLQRPVWPQSDFHPLILPVLSPDSAMWYRIRLPTVQSLLVCGLAYLLHRWTCITLVIKLTLERTSLRVTFSWSTIPHPPSQNSLKVRLLCVPRSPPPSPLPCHSDSTDPFPSVSSTRLSSWKASSQTHTSRRYSKHPEKWRE